jgi:cytochrome P450
MVTLEHLARLDFIEACMNETLLLKPMGPMLPLQALKDTQVGDVAVPAGTAVICLLRHDSVDDASVHDGRAFKPDAGWARLVCRRLRPSASRCPSAPVRACAQGATWRCRKRVLLLALLTRFDIEFLGTVDGGESDHPGRINFFGQPAGYADFKVERAAPGARS